MALLVAMSMVPAGEAQVTSCGEGFELFMRNPDMVPSNDGKFHVSGDFFVQFQGIGENADQIETFAFSVGLPPENPESICDLPVWPAGLMLEAYKVDQDKSDGFFILMNTGGQSTPQNTDLQVAVHGYDGSGAEVARFWGTAVVETCPGQTQGGCGTRNDEQIPWPVILPGDGEAALVDGFTVEFAEDIAELTVLLNGEDITDQMEDWTGRQWDSDTFYDYGPAGIFATAAPMCSLPAPIHQCVTNPGPSYQWTQRTMTADDVIRVEAIDTSGNVAKKEIHLGSSVAGGTIADGLPLLTMTFDETQQLAAPGETAIFQARMENTGGGTGHPFVSAVLPDANWTSDWFPGHAPVNAASQSTQELNVHIPLDQPAGIYQLTAVMEYQRGQEDKRQEFPLEVLVGGQVADENAEAAAEANEEPVEESPGLGVLLLPALAFVALVRRRT